MATYESRIMAYGPKNGDGAIGLKIHPDNFCDAKVKIVKCSCTWTIDNFSICRQQLYHYFASPEFTIRPSEKAKWNLELYPADHEKSRSEYVAIFLCRSYDEEELPVGVQYRVSIIDVKGNKKFSRSVDLYTYTHGSGPGCQSFVKREVLFDKATELMPNGQLTILCELDLIEDTIIDWSKISMIPIEVPACKFRENLENLFINKKYCDFTLVTKNDTMIHVSKIILAAASPVFSAMFENDMEQNNSNKANIDDIDEDILREMLRFSYTGKVENVDKIAKRLLVAARKYKMDRLSSMCEDALFKSLDLENAVDTFIHANRYEATQLRTKTIRFISKHCNGVRETKGFKELDTSSGALLLGELFNVFCDSTKTIECTSMEH